LTAIAAEHLRLIVTGPSSLQAGVAAEYLVSATAIDGRPLPAQIEATLSDPDGRRLKTYKEPVDEHGRLRVALPADLQLPPSVRLNVTASHRKSREEVKIALAVAPERFSRQWISDWPFFFAFSAGESAVPKLPEVAGDRDVALTAAAVFSADEPLRCSVQSAKAGLPLVVAVYGGGAQIGQQMLVTKPGAAGQSVTIPLDDAVAGVLRLVVYDYRKSPPEPAAARLVYRRGRGEPSRELEKTPGEAALELLAIGQEDPPSAQKPEQKPEQRQKPPFMYDNLERIRADCEKCLADYQADRTPALNMATVAGFLGGLGLILLVAMLGLLRIVSGIHLWVSAVGAAACCFIIGGILTDPSQLTSNQDTPATIPYYHNYAPPSESVP